MNETTLTKMNQMKLYGMHQFFYDLLQTVGVKKLTIDEALSMMVQAEWEDRENRKITRSLRNAKFRYNALMEQVDFTHQRGLDKNQFMRFVDCAYISKKENILIAGPTGVGKSYLASALGNQACMKALKVLYVNTHKLFTKLKIAKADGTYLKEIDKIERLDLLILDDFGLQPIDNQSRMSLMDIIEDRHGRKSTIVSSQLPLEKWYEVIGESTVADAIIDRLFNASHKIILSGESMRKNNKFESNR
jgi:DNA replication protein DnaC